MSRGGEQGFESTIRSYFNTFGGNPVSAAVGLAVLDVLEREGVQQNVIAAGKVLEPGLAALAAKYPLVADARDHATTRPVRRPSPRRTGS